MSRPIAADGTSRYSTGRPGHRVRMAGLIHDELVERDLLPADTDPLVTLITVEMGDRIVELAYRADPKGDRTILAEGQIALTRYLENYAR